MTTELIARLEVAPEGSRELSDEVLLAVGWTCDAKVWRTPDKKYARHRRPDPTRSIDAARSLMTPDWEWELRWEDGKAIFAIGDPARFIEAEAPTEALAICAGYFRALRAGLAAIKAREAG